MLFGEVVAVDTIPLLVILVVGGLAVGMVAAGGFIVAAWIVSSRLDRLFNVMERLVTAISGLDKRLEAVEHIVHRTRDVTPHMGTVTYSNPVTSSE